MLRLAGATIVLLIIVLIVALAEWALRAYGLGSPLLYEESNEFRYSLQPDQETHRLRNARVRIDRYGSRSDDDWDAAGATRILFIGDSVTYGGSYIDNTEIFSAVTCAELRSRREMAVCGNLGTNGYGVLNMAYRIRFASLPRQDLTVVTVLADDTLRGLSGLSAFPYFSQPLPALIPALTEAGLFAVDTARAKLRFDRGGGPFQARGEHAEAVADLALAELFSALEDVGPVLIVYSPLRRSVEAGRDPFAEYVLARLQSSGYPVLDMLTELAEHSQRLDEIYYDGAHLEVAGHSLYGEKIAEWRLTRATATSVSESPEEAVKVDAN
jgi:lysophospholipase L1-like esterase